MSRATKALFIPTTLGFSRRSDGHILIVVECPMV